MDKLKNIWKIEYEEKISASVEKLWELISSPSNLELFHPFCKTNKVITWPGKNSVDELIYLNNLKYIRSFISWEEFKGYSLLIGEENNKQSYVIWEISKKKGLVFLKITIYPYFLRNIPKAISYFPYKLFIIPKMSSYLKSVIGGINYYIERKKKTPKEYFGSHKWFS
ncbi:MAG: hypothetical protein ACJ0O0_00645 [Flavobacteriaceae bacterium]|tara:strand:- start:911 stop:1414 length:504 start_codon:yes stop_codon:yes gene_type:complete